MEFYILDIFTNNSLNKVFKVTFYQNQSTMKSLEVIKNIKCTDIFRMRIIWLKITLFNKSVKVKKPSLALFYIDILKTDSSNINQNTLTIAQGFKYLMNTISSQQLLFASVARQGERNYSKAAILTKVSVTVKIW